MPEDFRTTITSISPSVPGLSLDVVENGSRLKLTWRGSGTLVVIGNGGEPYLRLTPQGVETNQQSPDTYRNKDRRDLTETPEGVTGAEPPRWERTSTSPVAIWHEHRAHWVNLEKPASVGLVREWEVPLTVDSAPVSVRGTLVYLPGPSALPYVPVLVGALVLAVLAVRTGRWGALACVLVVAADALRAFGVALTAADARTSAVLQQVGLAGIGWLMLLVAAVLIWRRVGVGMIVAAVGGALVALAGALPASTALNSSLPLTVLPLALQRTAIALSLGGGIGLLIGLIAAFRQMAARDSRVRAGTAPS